MSDDGLGAGEADGAGFVGFVGTRRVAVGGLARVAVAVGRAREAEPGAAVLVFDRASGAVVDLDLRGSEAEIAARLAVGEGGPARKGRPRLGVVAREVTLLPRHWDWLARQPGGASVTLRRLVEAARKADDGARSRCEAAYRFMVAMAGDFAGFEAAARALFAGDWVGVERCAAGWPVDVREEIMRFVGIGLERADGA
jgi:hypothetical protein